jgi:pilus assembly protein CpaD
MPNPSRPSNPDRSKARAAAGAAVLALSLTGCAVDRSATTSTIPSDDYRVNHPVRLTESPVRLDVVPGPGRMDRATAARLKQFARAFKASGVGQMEALFPRGSANEASARGSLGEIRRALAEGGVGGFLSIGSYEAASPDEASPVRLAYRALRARVANPCGEWPKDLASAGSLDGWQNRPYWDFGCSVQTMVAEQVDDPRDLLAPRADAPVDVEMRRRGIEKVRNGSDPTSQWSVTVGGIN